MAEEWHKLGDAGLYEYYDASPGKEKYKVPSLSIDMDQFRGEECYDEDKVKFATCNFVYWLYNNGECVWLPMPPEITDLEDAKAYAMMMWRMQ